MSLEDPKSEDCSCHNQFWISEKRGKYYCFNCSRELIDFDRIRTAINILWIDEAEFYLCCHYHYRENSERQWTGSTKHEDHSKVKESARDLLDKNAACVYCKDERWNKQQTPREIVKEKVKT